MQCCSNVRVQTKNTARQDKAMFNLPGLHFKCTLKGKKNAASLEGCCHNVQICTSWHTYLTSVAFSSVVQFWLPLPLSPLLLMSGFQASPAAIDEVTPAHVHRNYFVHSQHLTDAQNASEAHTPLHVCCTMYTDYNTLLGERRHFFDKGEFAMCLLPKIPESRNVFVRV